MSTSGLYGFRLGGVDKVTYNHCDSYPDGLGKDFVKFCRKYTIDELKDFFGNIRLIEKNEVVTPKDVAYCESNRWNDYSVGSRKSDDWYCLTHELQGNFREYIRCINNGLKVYMINNINFIKLFTCEYAYIMNLDNETLEFWVGYQKEPWSENRYGTSQDIDGSYPAKLIHAFTHEEIKSSKAKNIAAAMNRMVDECSNDSNEVIAENLGYDRHKYLEDIGLPLEKCGVNFMNNTDKRYASWMEHRKLYAVDPRETWNLDYIFYQWAYERLVAYKEMTNVALDANDFEVNGFFKSFGEWLDEAIDCFKYLVLNYDFAVTSEEFKEKFSKAMDIWKEMIGMLWW